MTRKALLLSLPVLLLAAGRPGPAPRFDQWKVIGPGGGGTMISPTVSPHDPNVVVEHCDMTGGTSRMTAASPGASSTCAAASAASPSTPETPRSFTPPTKRSGAA